MRRAWRIFDFRFSIFDCVIGNRKSKIENTMIMFFLFWSFCHLPSRACAMEQKRPADAKVTVFASSTRQPVKTELVTEHASVQPGRSTRVGVHFELEAGWHIYAKDPGDAGLATSVIWSGPSGVSFGPIQWPPCQQFIDPGDIRTNGYTGAVVLPSVVQAASSTPVGTPLVLHATIKWLACKEMCLPGSSTQELSLPVSEQPQTPSPNAKLFESTGIDHY